MTHKNHYPEPLWTRGKTWVLVLAFLPIHRCVDQGASVEARVSLRALSTVFFTSEILVQTSHFIKSFLFMWFCEHIQGGAILVS